MHPFIHNHLDYINNIEQNPFNIINQLDIGINLSQNRNGNAFYLSNLRERLLNMGIPNMSRNDLLEQIALHHNDNVNPEFTIKELVTLIISWGIYFEVMQGTNGNNILHLSNFLDETDDLHFNNMENDIVNVDINEEDQIRNIFSSFSYNGNYKIPGLDYAFFTKLFFYFSQNNRLPILDKWLSKSFVYLINTDPQIDENARQIINQNFNRANGRIIRQRPHFYKTYVNYLNNELNEIQINFPTITMSKLETFLFGWDLRINNPNMAYPNPRLIY